MSILRHLFFLLWLTNIPTIFTTQMGFTGLWAQERSFSYSDPFLGCPCPASAVSGPGRELRGIPGAPLNTKGPARDILLSSDGNSSWVAKGKREGKITFPFWTREVIQWGPRHNNLYKEKKKRNDALESFPRSNSGAQTFPAPRAHQATRQAPWGLKRVCI